jgi:predicted nucleotidyltransferase
MSSLEAIKNTLSAHKKHLFDRYGLTNIAVFGSYVRNQQTAESDIDILVDYNQPIGAEFIDLAEELEQILSMKVDLVSKRGLKDRQFRAIENELSYV